jgi:hypothetical protein
MAQTKIYPSTQAQVQAVKNTVDEINSKITPQFSLSQVIPLVLDFVNDPIVIISGGLDTASRTIRN